MINMILITGFLGSGKTTLMLDLLQTYKDNKVGVIVNDFGKVNIDAKIIMKDGIQMAEMSNGSIFCACIKENFVNGLIEMSKLELDYLFVEASGLADPANISMILNEIKGLTNQKYHYKGAICVVDGDSFIGFSEMLPALIHQVEYSSTVIINKADITPKTRLSETAHRISQINPYADIIVTSFCNVDMKEIISPLKPASKKPEESLNTIESRPKTIVLNSEGLLPITRLMKFLKEISDSTYRIKGFANTKEGPIEINCVGKRISVLPWNQSVDHTQIVVISSVGIKIISKVADALEKYLADKLHM